MMTIPPEDEPTQRLPREPVVGEPVAREAVVSAEYAELRDRLRSLRTGLALLGVLAAAALAVGVVALLQADDNEGDSNGASQQQVSALEKRVDKLESRSDNTASDASISDVRDSIESLDSSVDELKNSAVQSSDLEPLQQDITELQQQVQDLEQQQTTP
jgi:chromosome segregation ATPase